jgi:hypothetical protein
LWKIYHKYEFNHRYFIGCDIASWTWLDSSVIQVLDTDTKKQIAEWESNMTTPEILAQELIDASKNFFDCPIMPENNGVWLAVISVIKEKGFEHLLPRFTKIDKLGDNVVDIYWRTTSSKNKSKMLYDLKRDFEEWTLEINSIPLLREMRWYSTHDIIHKSFNVNDEVTKHYDRVMAMAIANQYQTINLWDFSIWRQTDLFWRVKKASPTTIK